MYARPRRLGLEDSLAAELAGALRRNQRECRSERSLPVKDVLRETDFGLVFPARTHPPAAPAAPDHALEAGAADYCCPPFEPVQIRWLLENAQPAGLRGPEKVDDKR